MTMPVLRVISGPAAGGTISLDGVVTIGREVRPAVLNLAEDEELSRRHARFTRLASGAVLVEDLGSGNGTLVNGQPIEVPRLLEMGDEVQMGATTVRLEQAVAQHGAPPPPPPPPQPLPPRLPPVAPSLALSTLPAPPPAPLAPASPARDPHRPGGGWAVALVAALIAVALAFVGGRAVGQHAGTSTHDSAAALGTVYLESGIARPDGNAIIAYRYGAGGDLQPLDVREFPTGGAAGFDLSNTGALDADGQIVVSGARKLLFAVNQGSDTVAVFHIDADGGLSAVAGSPFASEGQAPGGLGISGDHLVVVNKAQDGVRDLTSVAPDVASFIIQANGALRPTGSVVTLPAGTSPTEALVTPDGEVVVVPEEHGPFVSLTLNAQGMLAPAPGSPFSLPPSLFPAGFPAAEQWALGLGAAPRGNVFYAQVVDTAQLAVYQYDDSGRLRFVRAVPDPGAYLPCWSLLNAAGTRLYTDNAGNNTMSVFDLTDPLNPRQLQVATLKNSGNPWDLRMSPSGRYVFVLDPRDREDLVPAGGGNELHTLVVNADGTLTEPSYSPVPIPVPLNTNPIGLVVTGH